MAVSYRYLRLRLSEAGLLPTSNLRLYLVSAGARPASVWVAVRIHVFQTILRTGSGGVVQLSEFRGCCSFHFSGIALGQNQDAVAAAQPLDRHLRVFRIDSGGPAGRAGIGLLLFILRPVCDFHRNHPPEYRNSGAWTRRTPLIAHEIRSRIEHGGNPEADAIEEFAPERKGMDRTSCPGMLDGKIILNSYPEGAPCILFFFNPACALE